MLIIQGDPGHCPIVHLQLLHFLLFFEGVGDHVDGAWLIRIGTTCEESLATMHEPDLRVDRPRRIASARPALD